MKAAVPLKQADSICFDLWGKGHYHKRVPRTVALKSIIFWFVCKLQVNHRKKAHFDSALAKPRPPVLKKTLMKTTDQLYF